MKSCLCGAGVDGRFSIGMHLSAGFSHRRFELPVFYREVRRILKPSGAFAAWGYDLCEFPENAEANKVLQHLYNGVLGPYWSERRHLVEAQYRGDCHWPCNVPESQRADPDSDTDSQPRGVPLPIKAFALGVARRSGSFSGDS